MPDKVGDPNLYLSWEVGLQIIAVKLLGVALFYIFLRAYAHWSDL